MSELWFKIGTSGLLGGLLLVTVMFGVTIITVAHGWMDRLAGVIIILLGLFVGFFIVCLWNTNVGGLE